MMHAYDVILPTLGDQFSAAAFGAAPNPRCKMLANFGVGYNHIDVLAAQKAGVSVSNTPGAVTDATADIAMSLILMSCRRLGEGERMVRANAWDGWHPTQLLGMHIGGKTLGIIGMGRIGKAIARRAAAGFGMNVIFYNRSTVDAPEHGTQMPEISQVLGASDVVVLAVPATPQTHRLMNAERFAQMQSHAHLINIARGDVVSQTALIDALERGVIGGAGLDVYEFEPDVPNALKAMENVVLLPHMGSATLEGRIEMGEKVIINIKTFDDGHRPPDQVVPSML